MSDPKVSDSLEEMALAFSPEVRERPSTQPTALQRLQSLMKQWQHAKATQERLKDELQEVAAAALDELNTTKLTIDEATKVIKNG